MVGCSILTENRFYAVLWFRAEAEPYSILTALGPEELKIALINSAVVMLQQSDLRETCSSNTGERLITSCYIKCSASTETNNAVQQRKRILLLSCACLLDLSVKASAMQGEVEDFHKAFPLQGSGNVDVKCQRWRVLATDLENLKKL